MTPRDDLDRQLSMWLDRPDIPASPRNLAAVVARTRHMRQRRAWASLERWLPMAVITHPVPALPMRAAWLTILTLLALAVAIAAAIVGMGQSRPFQSAVLPPPTGPAGNGLIAHDGGGDIWVVQPDGTGPTQLTSGRALDIQPSWSRDGTRIAYWSLTQPDATSTSINDADFVNAASAALVVMDADASSPVTVAEGLKVDWDFGTAVTWSPDSRSFAFSHLEGTVPVIEIVSLDDPQLEPVRLVEGWSPAWSPEGVLVAYRGSEQRPGVWLIAPDGSDRTCHKSCAAWVGRRITQVSGSGYAFTYPQWSAEGSLITFYAGPDGQHDTWVARTDGSEEWAIGSFPVEEYWPSFSPDGTRIAFGRDVGGSCCQYHFVVSNPHGTEQVTLDPGPFGPSTPNNWSPDGRFLLGERSADDGMAVLELVDASGQSAASDIVIPIEGDWANTSWQRVAPDPA